MSVADTSKQDIVKDNDHSANDTGSLEVRVALLTAHINELQPHFEAHMKDHHSRHGLLRMVSRHHRLLDYLRSKDADCYTTLVTKLNLRKQRWVSHITYDEKRLRQRADADILFLAAVFVAASGNW